MPGIAAAFIRAVRPTYLAAPLAVATAWMLLIVWSNSAYRGYLSHDALESFTLTQAWLVLVLIAGWMLMVIAMMLPANLPAMYCQIDGRLPVLAPLVTGYLAVWAGFGLLLVMGDLALHRLLIMLPSGGASTGMIFPALLILAGAYQLTPFKERCLRGLCTPEAASAPLRAGLRQGAACVECSWPLMLLMFAVGQHSLLWMALLGSLMAVERLTTWGREMAPSLGVALLGAGATLLLLHLLG
jgi:predicted metal-binding membrane protein